MQNHHSLLFLGECISDVDIDTIYKFPSHDVTHLDVDSLGIDDVRILSVQATQKPIELEKRVFVIVTRIITTAAQNALLKLFEEPPDTALFFLVVPKEGILLPTLRSRLAMGIDVLKVEDKNDAFASFLSSTYAKRFETIVELVKNKDQHTIEQIIRGAEFYVEKHTQKTDLLLRSIILIRSYIGIHGSSPKMLLEELALSLPNNL